MNEQRIRELAEQASTHAEETVHYYMGQFDGLTWEAEILKERDLKFAELIVKECRDIVEQDMKLAHIQMIPLTLEKYANGRLKEKIREHFGVEE
jgi:hypothetical protein